MSCLPSPSKGRRLPRSRSLVAVDCLSPRLLPPTVREDLCDGGHGQSDHAAEQRFAGLQSFPKITNHLIIPKLKPKDTVIAFGVGPHGDHNPYTRNSRAWLSTLTSRSILPISNVQPFSNRDGYGNKTRKLVNLRDVVCKLMRVRQNVLISLIEFITAPVRSAGPNQKKNAIERPG